MSQSRVIKMMRQMKSLPLRLPQNSLLTIKSSARVNVILSPEWRDDGHIALEQIYKCGTETDETGKIEWTVGVNDGKKEGLTSVDVSIQSLSNYDENKKMVSSVGEQLQNETVTEEAVTDTDLTQGDVPTFMATIPEKCNVKCILADGGDITVTKKLEGEDGFVMSTNDGNISVDKLRGESIELYSKRKDNVNGNGNGNSGTIFVKKSCEAQELNITVDGRLRAKMLNVANANIEAKDQNVDFEKLDDDDGLAVIDVSSIYTSLNGEGAHFSVSGLQSSDASEATKTNNSIKKVRIKSNHGHISVRTSSSFSLPQDSPIINEYGQEMAHVELGGVNGSFDVSIEREGGQRSIPKHNGTDRDAIPKAAIIHVDSLSPGQASIVTSDFGSIGISLDRKIESDIRLLSTPLINKMDPNVLLSEDEKALVDAISDHDDDIEVLMGKSDNANTSNPFQHRISLETEAFSGHRSSDMRFSEYVHGRVDNKSLEPNSRFDVKTKGISSSVGKIRIEGAAGQALQGFSGGSDKPGNEFDLPLLAAGTDGPIVIESLSWFGAIARRYGVEEGQRDLGRQAKAGGAEKEKKQ